MPTVTMSSRVRRAALALLPLLVLVAAPMRAGAADLETLRARAQEVADEVTALERRLAGLNARKSALEERLASADRELARLELERHEAEDAYQTARSRFVAAAVAVYKKGPPTEEIAVILSARSFADAEALAKAAGAATEAAADSLDRLTAAREEVEALQAGVAARKQKMIVAGAEIDAVASGIESTLADRKSTLSELNGRIAALEKQARAEARAEQADVGTVLQTHDSLSGIPEGFSGTGVTFQGIASWYGPGFEGNPTASGEIFDPDKLTAASRDLPLGTWLYVQHEGRGVVVKVNDRGPYIEDRILDLSRAAAQTIGITGLGWIKAEILIRH